MASDHEYIDFGLADVKKLFNTCLLTGQIISVDSANDKADVEIGGYGRKNGVPIFYHCPGSNTVEGGSSAFSEDDLVLVLAGNAEGSTSPDFKVVGFTDGLKQCTQKKIVFRCGSIYMVYDWDKDQLVAGPGTKAQMAAAGYNINDDFTNVNGCSDPSGSLLTWAGGYTPEWDVTYTPLVNMSEWLGEQCAASGDLGSNEDDVWQSTQALPPGTDGEMGVTRESDGSAFLGGPYEIYSPGGGCDVKFIDDLTYVAYVTHTKNGTVTETHKYIGDGDHGSILTLKLRSRLNSAFKSGFITKDEEVFIRKFNSEKHLTWPINSGFPLGPLASRNYSDISSALTTAGLDDAGSREVSIKRKHKFHTPLGPISGEVEEVEHDYSVDRAFVLKEGSDQYGPYWNLYLRTSTSGNDRIRIKDTSYYYAGGYTLKNTVMMQFYASIPVRESYAFVPVEYPYGNVGVEAPSEYAETSTFYDKKVYVKAAVDKIPDGQTADQIDPFSKSESPNLSAAIKSMIETYLSFKPDYYNNPGIQFFFF